MDRESKFCGAHFNRAIMSSVGSGHLMLLIDGAYLSAVGLRSALRGFGFILLVVIE